MPPRGYTQADHEFNAQLGARIRNRRLELGLKNPIDLARKALDAGTDPEEVTQWSQSLSSIERGGYAPRFRTLIALARALETTTAHLIGDADEDSNWRAGYTAGLLDAQEAIGRLRD